MSIDSLIHDARNMCEVMERRRADILSWCAYHVHDYEENPLIRFNREFNESLDPVSKALKPDSRIGGLSNSEYKFEKDCVTEFARVFGDDDLLSRQVVAERLFYMYGCLPEYLVAYDEHVKSSVNRSSVDSVLKSFACTV